MKVIFRKRIQESDEALRIEARFPRVLDSQLVRFALHVAIGSHKSTIDKRLHALEAIAHSVIRSRIADAACEDARRYLRRGYEKPRNHRPFRVARSVSGGDVSHLLRNE